MNPDLIFRLLQVGVVAPWLFLASKSQPAYFNIGLKLVAGTIVAMNAPVLMAAYRQYAASEASGWVRSQPRARPGVTIDARAEPVL